MKKNKQNDNDELRTSWSHQTSSTQDSSLPTGCIMQSIFIILDFIGHSGVVNN